MDYTGVARGATVQGAVVAGGAAGFDAGMAWYVMAACMMVLGLVMYAVLTIRNQRDTAAANGIARIKRTRRFRR